jgi:hypothetical protein
MGKITEPAYIEIQPAFLFRKDSRETNHLLPSNITYSLHYTDPTLRDVYREIIAVCFQNRMKVTVYGLKAEFLNVTAGGP